MKRTRVIKRLYRASLVAMVVAVVILSASDRGYAVWLNTPRASYGVSIGAGALCGYWINQPYSPRTQPLFKFTSTPGTRRAEWLPRFQRSFGYRLWVLPIWLVVLPAVAIVLLARRVRGTSDACPNCRYPLRGLKPAALGVRVCPECGSPIEALPSENERGAGTLTPTVFPDRVEREKLVIGPRVAGKFDERTVCAESADHPPTRGTEHRDPPNRHTEPDKSGQPE